MPLPTDLLRDFAARYIWWRDEHPSSGDRIMAQVMSIGTYDDIRRLEGVCSPSELHDIIAESAAGLDQRPLVGILAWAPACPRRRGSYRG